MNPKIWIALCSSLLLYNLPILWRDSYSINYVVVEREDRLYDEATNFLICVQWSEIRYNDNGRFDSLLITNASVEDLLDYCILSIETRLNTSNLFSNKNQTFVFNKSFCFLTTKEELEKEKPLAGLLNCYYTRFYIFSNGKLPIFYEYVAYKWDEFNSFHYFVRTIKQKVYGENFLKNPNCFTYQGQLASNRAYCLNRCFRAQGIKMNFYTLADRETRFDLRAIHMEGKNKTKKQYFNQFLTLSRVEKYMKNDEYGWQGEQYNVFNSTCYERCPQNTDCFLEAFDTVVLNRSYYERFRKERGKQKVDLTQILYQGHYSMDDYYLQLFGLLTLFSGTSVLAALIRLSDSLTKRIRTSNRYLQYAISKSRFVLVLAASVFILLQSGLMLTKYRFRSVYPNKTNILNFTSDPFSLVVCFPVEILLHNDDQIVNGRNSAILKRLNLVQLRNSTGAASRLIEKFEIFYGLRAVDFNFEISYKILFQKATFEEQPCLARCFRVEFSVLEPSYRVMLPLLYLSIEFRTKYWELYVIERNQNFTSNLNSFSGSFLIRKNTLLSSTQSKKSNCLNYMESSEDAGCYSMRSCYDRCVNRMFFRRYGSISVHSIIDGDALVGLDRVESARFNDSGDSEIEANCHHRFSRIDCVSVFFEESLELVENLNQNYSVFMKLNFENLVEKELEKSFLKVTIDIVNLKAIVIGLNATGLLSGLFPILRKLFKWFPLRLNRLFSYRLLVLALCFLGFSTHNIFLFNGIIKSDLIESGSFQKSYSYNLPNLIFCVAINQTKLDEHLFFEDHDIRLTHFYHSNLKCFKIHVKTTFNEQDFHFYNTNKVFRVRFRDPWFFNTYDSVLFMYQERQSQQIDGGFLVRIGWVNPVLLPNLFYYNKVEFQFFEIYRQDNFELLREPASLTSLFYEKTNLNDVTKTMESMKAKFKSSFNLTSRANLLDLNDRAYRIDESMYRQYYLQVQNKTDHEHPRSLNFRQRRFNILNQIYHRFKGDWDFSFSISLTSRHTEIVNEDNYSKLLISVLNALSLWFNISVLNLIVGIHKLVEFNLLVYKLLNRAKDHLALELKNGL